MLYKGLEIVTMENLRIGKKVKRGRDWIWNIQDCDEKGKETIGTIIDRNSDRGWVDVSWDGGKRNCYRCGKSSEKEAYDLVYYNSSKQLEFDMGE